MKHLCQFSGFSVDGSQDDCPLCKDKNDRYDELYRLAQAEGGVMEEPCTVYIRKNETGEIREFQDTWYGSDFMWRDGNFACDCNRALFFARAKDEDDPDETPCGYDKYTITKIVLGGTVVYTEGE